MRFPIGFSAVQTSASASTASGAVIAANPSRKYLGIFNVGQADVTINAAGATAVAGTGVVLGAASAGGVGGGSIVWEATGVPVNGLTCRTAAGTSTLIVVEGQ